MPGRSRSSNGIAFCTRTTCRNRNRNRACRQGTFRCTVNQCFPWSQWPQLHPHTAAQPDGQVFLRPWPIRLFAGPDYPFLSPLYTSSEPLSLASSIMRPWALFVGLKPVARWFLHRLPVFFRELLGGALQFEKNKARSSRPVGPLGGGPQASYRSIGQTCLPNRMATFLPLNRQKKVVDSKRTIS